MTLKRGFKSCESSSSSFFAIPSLPTAYKTGKSAFSFYNLPKEIHKISSAVVDNNSEIIEGVCWPQGDHSIFIQYGRPAIAVSSQWFTENIDSQNITHTPKDNVSIVDCNNIADITESLFDLINKL